MQTVFLKGTDFSGWIDQRVNFSTVFVIPPQLKYYFCHAFNKAETETAK